MDTLATNTVLIVKEQYLDKARDIIDQTGVTATSEGKRHMVQWLEKKNLRYNI